MGEDKVVQEVLKNALAVMKEKTLYGLMENDKSYCESAARRKEAEKRYLEIRKHLSEDILEIIEEYLDAIDLNSTDENDLHYLAGMTDAVRAMASYGMLK